MQILHASQTNKNIHKIITFSGEIFVQIQTKRNTKILTTIYANTYKVVNHGFVKSHRPTLVTKSGLANIPFISQPRFFYTYFKPNVWCSSQE